MLKLAINGLDFRCYTFNPKTNQLDTGIELISSYSKFPLISVHISFLRTKV